jgi:geranylgeranyl diphosphate synthase type I
MTLPEALEELLPQIEAELQEITRIPHPSLALYYGMIHYHLGWVNADLKPLKAATGKRLRPLLCLFSCQAMGGSTKQALPAAGALELIHNFSLAHDDIQDSSRTRRGRRAAWDIWGTAHGINLGDGLFVLARLALYRLADAGVSPRQQQAASLALDQACLALCEGQFFDMIFQDRLDVDLDQYLWMIRHKTAALLAASTQVGAMMATDQADLIRHFYDFGENLGMAFQVQDDILGIWGHEQRTGKSAATDLRDKKKTLPVVYALNQTGDRAAAHQLAELYAGQGPLDEPAIQSALGLLVRVGAKEHAQRTAEGYYFQALKSLEQTGVENAAYLSLRELAASLLDRDA